MTRNYLAHINADGSVNAWDPGANSAAVVSLAVNGSTVYAGGDFTTMGGQSRNRIAAIDAATDAVTAFDANANNQVATLAVSGSTVYAGGAFTTISGQSRRYIAALDATTGLATNWDPNLNNTVNAMIVNGATLYAGGAFTTVGSVAWPRFAALPISTLPLRFVSFTATAQRNAIAQVICNWTTADEQNTSHFIVERSAEGVSFSGIGTVNAAGNSSFDKHYSFTDNSPLATTSWYRIKQVDRDDYATYSKMVTVLSGENAATIRLAPNPVQQDATLMVNLAEKDYVRYCIYDQSGKMVATSFLHLDKGNNSLSLPLQPFIKGVYTIQVKGTKTNTSLQFVKQ